MRNISILLFIVFTLSSCQKNDISPENVKVIFHTDNLTFNPERLTFNYRAQGSPCDMSWHVVTYKDKPDFSLTLTIKESYKCKDFESEKFKHAAMLKEIFKAHDKIHLKHIRTPPLSIVQPNKSWNKNLSLSSAKSPYWTDWFENYPNNKKGLHNILVDLVNEKNIVDDFKSLFHEHGITIRLSSIEKVSSKKRGSTYYKNLPGDVKSIKRVLFDASTYWYEIKKID